MGYFVLFLILYFSFAHGGTFTYNSVTLCDGSQQSGCSGSSCGQVTIPDSCGSISNNPFPVSLYGSITCSSNNWDMKLCADSGCSLCVSGSQSIGGSCASIPGIPGISSGFQVQVNCNQLTILSYCLIGLAVLFLLCGVVSCCCRAMCCCCDSDTTTSSITTVRVYESPTASLLPSRSRAEQRELREELARSKKRTEALSSKLSETQRDLMFIRSNMESRVNQQQPLHQPSQWYPARPNTGYEQVGNEDPYYSPPPPTGMYTSHQREMEMPSNVPRFKSPKMAPTK